jgi:hypothetical protein
MTSERDAEFARRLGEQDETVLKDIEGELGDGLRYEWRHKVGPRLTHQDVEGIIEQTLIETWSEFKPSAGPPVSWFFFTRGRARLVDHFRRKSAAELAERIAAQHRPMISKPDDDPLEEVIMRDAIATLKCIRPLIDEAVREMTELQRTAFWGRINGGRHWAKDLATNSTTPAKQWRKTYDDAEEIVKSFLKAKGVAYVA